tara:strand:+ start:54 stop:686 length:633 start_codon:yes stop_codon:yes gene_type:complete
MKLKNKFPFLDYNWTDDTHHTPSIIPTINKILSTIKTKKLTHIDIGCGNGFITKKISPLFKESVGIDLSAKGIAYAKKNSNLSNTKFLNKDIGSLINVRKKFDFVTSIEVLEHQYDPFKFMRDIEKVTKKGGYVLITTPYHGYIKNLVISLFGLMDKHYTALWTHGHIKFFSIKTLKKLISNYKFRIIKIKYSGRIYPLSSSMIFLLKKK